MERVGGIGGVVEEDGLAVVERDGGLEGGFGIAVAVLGGEAGEGDVFDEAERGVDVERSGGGVFGEEHGAGCEEVRMGGKRFEEAGGGFNLREFVARASDFFLEGAREIEREG